MKELSVLRRVSAFFALGFVLFLAQPAFSQEEVPEEEIIEENSGRPFDSREKLNDTLLESIEGEDARVQTFVDNLSDDQVFALNRSLNNAVNSELDIIFDLDLLERIVDEDLDKRQINALTRALEQEANFLAKFEKTGDPKFREKAEQEKEKFLAKIDKFVDTDSSEEITESSSIEILKVEFETREARKNSREAVKEERNRGREVAKEARKEARKAAKESSRAEVKEFKRGRR